MRRQNSGVGASTVAATDYNCNNSGESANENDDNVNMGSTEDIEESMMRNQRDRSQENN
jgi:hypothetical protein